MSDLRNRITVRFPKISISGIKLLAVVILLTGLMIGGLLAKAAMPAKTYFGVLGVKSAISFS